MNTSKLFQQLIELTSNLALLRASPQFVEISWNKLDIYEIKLIQPYISIYNC